LSCRSNQRHWFTKYGYPGVRSATCVRCGELNPYWQPKIGETLDDGTTIHSITMTARVGEKVRIDYDSAAEFSL
jgi:hypothetical protein